MAGDGRAGEFLQDAKLDFVGAEGDEAVEAGGEAFGCFAGEPRDEIDVEEGVGVLAQEAEVVRGAFEVLRAADGFKDLRIERLQADFELEGAGRKAREDFAQFGGKAVGQHFEVEEEAGELRQAFKKEGKDFDGAGDVEIERAVAELELPRAASEKLVERGEQGGHGEEADGRIVGRDAVIAAHGAAARGFDVEQAVGEIGVGVFVVGELERGEIGGGGRRSITDGHGWTRIAPRRECRGKGRGRRGRLRRGIRKSALGGFLP